MKEYAGIPMTEEELKDFAQVWKDIEDAIDDVMKSGVDL